MNCAVSVSRAKQQRKVAFAGEPDDRGSLFRLCDVSLDAERGAPKKLSSPDFCLFRAPNSQMTK
jgi:hypothetical protein